MMEKNLQSQESNTPHHNLKTEIYDAICDGYEVSLGCTEDEAYLKPNKINDMFETLDTLGCVFLDRREDIVSKELGRVSLFGANKSELRKIYVRKEYDIEKIREELLFDETKMPWHKQRGCALALQTIADAHDLITCDSSDNDGLYLTMNGRLPYYNGDYVFNDDDGSLKGLNLRDAIIQSRQRFYGESFDDSSNKADESLVDLDSFFHAPATKDFKDIVAYCYDSLGIRSRKQEVCMAVSEHVDKILKNNPDKDNLNLLSVGCGTAHAILEVASNIQKRGIKPNIILLDQDPIALAAAKNLANQMGLSDYLEVHCERLFDQKGQPLDMIEILKGRKIDVAEDTGLREYLPDKIYCNLTNAIWNHLSPDGIITTGNMNANRPQPEFLHGLMGWYPNVIMRNIKDGFRLHEKSGIPKGSTTARVTRDGVYTLFFSCK